MNQVSECRKALKRAREFDLARTASQIADFSRAQDEQEPVVSLRRKNTILKAEIKTLKEGKFADKSKIDLNLHIIGKNSLERSSFSDRRENLERMALKNTNLIF